MPKLPPALRGQFSLLHLLFAALLVGAVVGIAGPPLVRLLEVRPAPLPPPSVPSRAVPDWQPHDGYYESGETPLD